MFRRMQDDINFVFFSEFTRVEQDRMLQALYDKGYSVKDIGKKLGMNVAGLYNRIDAWRGRGPGLPA